MTSLQGITNRDAYVNCPSDHDAMSGLERSGHKCPVVHPPTLQATWPTEGIGEIIQRYIVVEAYDGTKTDDVLLYLDWVCVGINTKMWSTDSVRPVYVPTNLSRMPEKLRSALNRYQYGRDSLNERPGLAWASWMRHCEHEQGASESGPSYWRRKADEAVKEADRAMYIGYGERAIETHARWIERARHAREQWIAYEGVDAKQREQYEALPPEPDADIRNQAKLERKLRDIVRLNDSREGKLTQALAVLLEYLDSREVTRQFKRILGNAI